MITPAIAAVNHSRAAALRSRPSLASSPASSSRAWTKSLNASCDMGCGPCGAASSKRTEATWPARACTFVSRTAPEGSRASTTYQWSGSAGTLIGAASRPNSAWPSRTSTRAPKGHDTSTSDFPSACARYSTVALPSTMRAGGGASTGFGAGAGFTCWTGAAHAAATARAAASFFMRTVLTRFEDLAILHHEVDVLEGGDVVERILIDRDQVGELSRRDRSDVAGRADRRLGGTDRVEQRRRHAGGRFDRRHRRHSIADHDRQFLGLVFRPGLSAHVGAVGDAHVALQCLGEGLALDGDHVGPHPAPPLRHPDPHVPPRAPPAPLPTTPPAHSLADPSPPPHVPTVR